MTPNDPTKINDISDLVELFVDMNWPLPPILIVTEIPQGENADAVLDVLIEEGKR